MEIIEITDDWQSAERFYISYFRFLGFRLTNHDGGGNHGYTKSEETKRKIAIAATGRKMSQEAIDKIRATKLANMTPELREKLAAINRGRKQSPETIAKRMAGKIGRKLSEETRRKIAAKATGRKHTPETLEKMRIASTGRPKTAAELLKLSAASKGKKAHPNTIKALNEHRPKHRTPEQVARHKELMTGYKWSEEALAKRAAALRAKLAGVPRSEEVKAKMRAGWERRRQLGLKRKPRTLLTCPSKT